MNDNALRFTLDELQDTRNKPNTKLLRMECKEHHVVQTGGMPEVRLGAPLPASIRFLLNFKVFYWLIISISTRIKSSELHESFLDAMNIVNASSRISIRLMLVSCVFLALSLDSEILGLCRRPVRPEIFETSPTLARVQILGLQGRLT